MYRADNTPNNTNFFKLKLFLLMLVFSIFASSTIFYINANIRHNDGVVLANLILDSDIDENYIKTPIPIEFTDYTFSNTYLRYLEYIYGVEIREIPLWGSKFVGYPHVRESQVMLGLSLMDNRKILLYTEGMCDYLRWRTLFHELYHVILDSEDEKKADEYADERMKEINLKRTADCEPIK